MCANAFKRLSREQPEEERTSKLVEDLFDDIIAKDSLASRDIGTDNMTCILVKFKKR